MAGKIVADLLEHSTAGSIATNYVVEGSAKAYWRSATTYTLGASLNVSSMTDNSTGNYDVSFSSAFASSTDIVNTFGNVSSVSRTYGGYVLSASQVSCRMFNSSGTANDTNATGNVHGDLA